MTFGVWITIYLLVSIGVALVAWRESARVDRVRRFGHLRRLVMGRRMAMESRRGRACERLGAVHDGLARRIGADLARTFRASQIERSDFLEAWGKWGWLK